MSTSERAAGLGDAASLVDRQAGAVDSVMELLHRARYGSTEPAALRDRVQAIIASFVRSQPVAARTTETDQSAALTRDVGFAELAEQVHRLRDVSEAAAGMFDDDAANGRFAQGKTQAYNEVLAIIAATETREASERVSATNQTTAEFKAAIDSDDPAVRRAALTKLKADAAALGRTAELDALFAEAPNLSPDTPVAGVLLKIFEDTEREEAHDLAEQLAALGEKWYQDIPFSASDRANAARVMLDAAAALQARAAAPADDTVGDRLVALIATWESRSENTFGVRAAELAQCAEQPRAALPARASVRVDDGRADAREPAAWRDEDDDVLAYIRRTYKVPAYVGHMVSYTGGGPPRWGEIAGADGPYVKVRWDGHDDVDPGRYHPTWEMIYAEIPPSRADERGEFRTSSEAPVTCARCKRDMRLPEHLPKVLYDAPDGSTICEDCIFADRMEFHETPGDAEEARRMRDAATPGSTGENEHG